MKKVSKEELVKLLKNKKSQTYTELSKQTGYHPKYLIKLNQALKSNHYTYIRVKRSGAISDSIKSQILEDYLRGDYCSYLDFFRKCGKKYSVSYSFLCKFLSSVSLDMQLLLIVKVKKYQNTYFVAIDYSRKKILYQVSSKKNDCFSVREILYYILTTYGSPTYISFVHCLKVIPAEIEVLLNHYHILNVPYKTVYHSAIISSNLEKEKMVCYRTCQVQKEHFLNRISRKAIQDNLLQFSNIRYLILSDTVIPKGVELVLYYDEVRNPIYVLYQGISYQVKECQRLQSKRGNSKYN